MLSFNLADCLVGPTFFLTLVFYLFSCGVEYQSWADSPSQVGNGAPSESDGTPSPSKVGKELVA